MAQSEFSSESTNHSDQRAYIRHPVQMPISVSSDASTDQLNLQLSNVSEGGLSFQSPDSYQTGTVVKIKIPTKPVFKVHAIVQWCRKLKESFELGVRFLDRSDAFRVRMVEQVCHIEQYRLTKQREKGKRMTRNQASQEWISENGGQFPH